jgi:hypothetical protein
MASMYTSSNQYPPPAAAATSCATATTAAIGSTADHAAGGTAGASWPVAARARRSAQGHPRLHQPVLT